MVNSIAFDYKFFFTRNRDLSKNLDFFDSFMNSLALHDLLLGHVNAFDNSLNTHYRDTFGHHTVDYL